MAFELLVARLGQRGDRVEYRHRDHPDQQRDEHGRGQKLPDRNPGGAGDDKLVVAGQPPEGEHRAEQDRERHHLLRRVRQLQRRHLEQQPQGRLDFGAAAADQLDVVEQEGDDDHRREDAAEPCRELAGDIGGEGLRDVQRPPPNRRRLSVRRARRRASASGNRALSRRAAGSQTRARTARGRPHTSAGSPPVMRAARFLTPRSSNSKTKASPIARRTRFNWPRRLNSPGNRQASGITRKAEGRQRHQKPLMRLDEKARREGRRRRPRAE